MDPLALAESLARINVRQTAGYKKKKIHIHTSAHGHSTASIYQHPSANTEPFIGDSLSVMYAEAEM